MSDFEQREPSEQELREYLEQLRTADPGEFLAQAFNILATGAQAKLGLPDARILIDAMSGLVEGAGEGIPEAIATPMRNGVVQLKTAQVQAEKELGQAEGAPVSQQPPDSSGPQPPGPGGGQPGGDQRMTDRLWIPGRGPQG